MSIILEYMVEESSDNEFIYYRPKNNLINLSIKNYFNQCGVYLNKKSLDKISRLDPSDSKYQFYIWLWKRLPSQITKIIGPIIRTNMGI